MRQPVRRTAATAGLTLALALAGCGGEDAPEPADVEQGVEDAGREVEEGAGQVGDEVEQQVEEGAEDEGDQEDEG